MVIVGLLPFSIVSNSSVGPFVSMESNCYDTFIKYLHKLKFAVEEEIKSRLPKNISLIFFRWNSGQTNYLAVYLSYQST